VNDRLAIEAIAQSAALERPRAAAHQTLGGRRGNDPNEAPSRGSGRA
jgi:hypothetical protein